MTVKAVYEDGVLKPKNPLPFKEHEEVEIDVRRVSAAEVEDDDPTGWKTARAFVGMIKNAPKGVPIARDHDDYLD